MMGRKFENNKLKMAKTALAYAKKASYIGKKVVVAVKAGGDDPTINLQLAKVCPAARSHIETRARDNLSVIDGLVCKDALTRDIYHPTQPLHR